MANCYVCKRQAGDYRQHLNDGYTIIKCSNCGLEYTDPVPEENKLKILYEGYHDIRASKEIVELNVKEHLKLLGKFSGTRQSKILDFGAGNGIFVKVAGYNCYGLDFKKSQNPRIGQSLKEFEKSM